MYVSEQDKKALRFILCISGSAHKRVLRLCYCISTCGYGGVPRYLGTVLVYVLAEGLRQRPRRAATRGAAHGSFDYLYLVLIDV